MTHRIALAAAVAALSLSACSQNKEPEVVGGPVDPMANEIANAAPPPALPSIAATKKYRCTGNQLVSIDWTELNGAPAGANVRIGDATTPTILSASADGKSFAGADGSTLTGAKDSASVTLTVPGTGELSCKG